MKKIFAVIVTAFMMATALVALTGTSAQAARCPYTGCIRTETFASGPYGVQRGKSTRIKVRVAAAGNARPRGTLIIVVRKQGAGKVRTKTTRYFGTPKVINTGKLRTRGNYKVIIKYKPGPNDPFKKSRDLHLLRVR